MKYFKLPDLGEGLAEAEIVEWHVREGEQVEADQLLLSVETAKALVDVPSPVAGTIAKLFGQPGDLVHIGEPLVEFRERQSDDGTVVGQVSSEQLVMPESFSVAEQAVTPVPGEEEQTQVQALPSVRQLAQRLEVDLTQVQGSGPGGTVSADDVERAFARQPHFHGEILKGARRAMVKAMADAHRIVVPVSLSDEADLRHWPADEDVTVRLIKAIGFACSQEPALNVWFDGDSLSRRLFDEVNVAIAVDSKHGLYVPVIQNVVGRSDADLRQGLDRMIADVRARAVPREMLQGATITLTNYGAIAGLYATPMVTPPQVAIVGAGRIVERLVQEGGELRTARMLPLSLTFDHRACTGGEAARFMKAMILALEHPEKATAD